MANQWALLTGINRYAAMQPLMYAQADAVALRNFFVDELGVPVEHCRLLSDLPAAVEPYVHRPTRLEIEAQLQTFCQESVQPGDLLWVFFSGYGLTKEGQDYWMPVDADSQNLDETAIAATTLFDILKSAKTEQILLVMDINRSQGAIGHQNIGEQFLALAQAHNIPTLMSCQPSEYSHETMALRHGLFTKALLEGMRYHGCVTAAQLVTYVRDRVPELSQHHWRPPQNPTAIMPAAQKFMLVVPPEGISRLPTTERAALSLEAMASPVDAEVPVAAGDPSRPSAPGESASGTTPLRSPDDAAASMPLTEARPSLETASDPPQSSPESVAIVPISDKKTDKAPGFSRWWQLAIVGAILVALAGIFWQYRTILLGPGESAEAPAPVAEMPAGDATGENAASEADASGEIAPAETPEAGTGESPPPNPLFSAEEGAGESTTALQRAEAAIAAGRYGEAQNWLNQVPPEQRDDTYEALLNQTREQIPQATQRNQQVLNQARQTLQPLSASALNDAIEAARQVPADDPYYEQAQADIARWSRMILDVAEGRAASGNLTGAIAAAGLVPQDQPAVYTLAQQQIQTWEPQRAVQQQIQQAQAAIVPQQASSFQNAIRTLQSINQDQPGYSLARARIDQWSQEIMEIARNRAIQGDLSGAIAAARLVPEGTAAYPEAQQEIQRWQG